MDYAAVTISVSCVKVGSNANSSVVTTQRQYTDTSDGKFMEIFWKLSGNFPHDVRASVFTCLFLPNIYVSGNFYHIIYVFYSIITIIYALGNFPEIFSTK
jgi:hypothetical protein